MRLSFDVVRRLLLSLALAASVTACGGLEEEQSVPVGEDERPSEDPCAACATLTVDGVDGAELDAYRAVCKLRAGCVADAGASG